jgi:hypothetical protein
MGTKILLANNTFVVRIIRKLTMIFVMDCVLKTGVRCSRVMPKKQANKFKEKSVMKRNPERRNV